MSGISLFGEKSLKAVIGFVVTVLFARAFGPELTGVLSLSLSLISIMLLISSLGMKGVLTRRLCDPDENKTNLMSAAFVSMFSASLICFALVILGTVLFVENDDLNIALLWLSPVILTAPSMVVRSYFESQMESQKLIPKLTVILLIFAILKSISICFFDSFFLFLCSSVIEFYAVLFVSLALIRTRKDAFKRIILDFGVCLQIIKPSFPYLLSSISILTCRN